MRDMQMRRSFLAWTAMQYGMNNVSHWYISPQNLSAEASCSRVSTCLPSLCPVTVYLHYITTIWLAVVRVIGEPSSSSRDSNVRQEIKNHHVGQA